MPNPTKRCPKPETLLIHCECGNVGCRRPVTVPTGLFIGLPPLHYVCHPECKANPGSTLLQRCGSYNVWQEEEHGDEGS